MRVQAFLWSLSKGFYSLAFILNYIHYYMHKSFVYSFHRKDRQKLLSYYELNHRIRRRKEKECKKRVCMTNEFFLRLLKSLWSQEEIWDERFLRRQRRSSHKRDRDKEDQNSEESLEMNIAKIFRMYCKDFSNTLQWSYGCIVRVFRIHCKGIPDRLQRYSGSTAEVFRIDCKGLPNLEKLMYTSLFGNAFSKINNTNYTLTFLRENQDSRCSEICTWTLDVRESIICESLWR